MRFSSSLLVAFLFLWVRSGTAQSPKASTSAKKDDCSVAGMVVKLGGNEPLKSAIVVLQSSDDKSRNAVHVNSDSDGRFQVKGIPPGNYRMHVTRNGFVSQEYGQRSVNTPGATLALSPGQNMNDLLFRLMPSAIISGRIENEDGEALPWAQVSALREVYSDGKRSLSIEGTVPTNDRGEYRLFELRPGRYFIAAVYNPGATRMADENYEEFGSMDSVGEGYVRTYYPGSPDSAKAESITVKAGEEIPSMDFMLRPTPVFRVKGRVYNLLAATSKHSHSSAMVFLDAKNSRLLNAGQTFGPGNITKSDGSFDLPGVLPGSYVLTARWFDEDRVHTARQNIEVGNADVEGVLLTISKAASISGHVRWEGSPAMEEGDDLFLSARGADELSQEGAYARVDPDGSFSWNEVPEGPLRVTAYGLSPDGYVKAVSYGNVDATAEGFTARAGSVAALEVTLSARGARVRGGVADSDGLPSVGVWVVLVPDAARRERHDLYKTARTDQHGQFVLRGLTPGDYKLFSWDQIDEGAWEDPDFLKPFEEKGEKVTVQEGDLKSVNLTAIKTNLTEEQKP
jgi:hypothetical protein